MDALLKPTVRANTRQRQTQPQHEITTASTEQAYIHLPIAQRSLPKRKILHNRDQDARSKNTAQRPSQHRHTHPDISPSTRNPRHIIQFHSTKLNKFSPRTVCSTTPAHDAHPYRTPANARRRQTHKIAHRSVHKPTRNSVDDTARSRHETQQSTAAQRNTKHIKKEL